MGSGSGSGSGMLDGFALCWAFGFSLPGLPGLSGFCSALRTVGGRGRRTWVEKGVSR